MVRSSYIKQHSLCFQHGKSHKDILWTVHLAVGNGRLYVLDVQDYIYINNTVSITHRPDYYDIRAISYVDVIAEIIRLAEQEQNKKIKSFLLSHALVEARHFLGLYRNRIQDKPKVKAIFCANISLKIYVMESKLLAMFFFFIKLASMLA
ncbi:hypothetical protein [Enterobacter ludwigii]|uniref:hypothetical protein n=1 Tax=Enterobacter ludwigii TaxID=299767 RepID=UPI003208DB86